MGDAISKGCFTVLIVLMLLIALPMYFAAAYLPSFLNYAFYILIVPVGILIGIVYYLAQVQEYRNAGYEPDGSTKCQMLIRSAIPLVICIPIAYLGFKAILPDMESIKRETGYYKPKSFVEEPYSCPREGYRGHTWGYWNLYQEGKRVGFMSFKVYDDDTTSEPIDSARIWIDNEVMKVNAKETMRVDRDIKLSLSGGGLSSLSIIDKNGELIKTDGTKYSFSRAGIIEDMIPNETHTWQDKMNRYMWLFVFLVMGPITASYWLYKLMNWLTGSKP